MAKTCLFTGRTSAMGNQKTYRGKAKFLGGVGKKITGISRRKFKPNLQRVRATRHGAVGIVQHQQVGARATQIRPLARPRLF